MYHSIESLLVVDCGEGGVFGSAVLTRQTGTTSEVTANNNSKTGTLQQRAGAWRSHDGHSLGGDVNGRAHRLQALAADPAAVLAAADPVQLGGHTGDQQQHFAQDDKHWQGQRHHEAGRQVEAVGLLLEGPLPAKQEAVQRGDEQGDVAKGGLREIRQPH